VIAHAPIPTRAGLTRPPPRQRRPARPRIPSPPPQSPPSGGAPAPTQQWVEWGKGGGGGLWTRVDACGSCTLERKPAGTVARRVPQWNTRHVDPAGSNVSAEHSSLAGAVGATAGRAGLQTVFGYLGPNPGASALGAGETGCFVPLGVGLRVVEGDRWGCDGISGFCDFRATRRGCGPQARLVAL
jgi:hypothetical protein